MRGLFVFVPPCHDLAAVKAKSRHKKACRDSIRSIRLFPRAGRLASADPRKGLLMGSAYLTNSLDVLRGSSSE